ncbi:MAG: hypothetical protein MUO54_12940, partial [Anaerolineales bacterium]|nr:hypothetical protein [Anaerolineales bacterium]
SLITLLKYIINRLAKPLSKEHLAKEDLVSIGIYLASQKNPASGLSVLSHVIKNIDLPDHLHNSALTHLASLLKKSGDYPKAVSLWKLLASRGIIDSHTELAMYYEHKCFDYQEAIHWTLSAAEALANESISVIGDKTQKALDHRLSRLKQKISRLNQ